jgi:copper chaperone CopZ
MKSIIVSFIVLLAALPLSAQEAPAEQPDPAKIVTTEFKVLGNCGECKERIESALDISGIKFAEWDQETEMLTVVYKTSKITEEEIHKALVEAGHETSKMKPEEAKYKALPACCQYHDHEKH